jgi:hypothetical protein
MPKYRKAVGNPLLIFFMQLDSSKCVIPGINRGRLVLLDDEGQIGRWVFTSSYDGKQNVNDWNKTGGVIPPTSSMPGGKYWEFHTKRLIQPGQPVDDGFLLTFDGKTTYTTVEGGTRSEIMVHNDANRGKALGSYGCPVGMTTEEYEDYCLCVSESISHLKTIRMASMYSF